MTRLASLVGMSLALLACQSGAAIGTPCTLASQCASPLVCRIGHCRNECVAARDCPAGQVCLLNADGLGACELPAVDVCSVSCDPPLICAAGHCRVECTLDGECPGGHVCRSGACERADTIVDAGPSDASRPNDTGLACDPVAETGCSGGERCSVGTGSPACVSATGSGILGDACSGDVDCGAGLSCQGARCVRVCRVGDSAICGSDSTCSYDSVHGQVFLSSTNGIGLCTQDCDLLTDARCLGGGSCALGTDPMGHDFTWCRDVGSVANGQACTQQFDCAAGLYCYVDGFCRPFCDPANAAATCSTTCDPATHLAAHAQVGACIP